MRRSSKVTRRRSKVARRSSRVARRSSRVSRKTKKNNRKSRVRSERRKQTRRKRSSSRRGNRMTKRQKNRRRIRGGGHFDRLMRYATQGRAALVEEDSRARLLTARQGVKETLPETFPSQDPMLQYYKMICPDAPNEPVGAKAAAAVVLKSDWGSNNSNYPLIADLRKIHSHTDEKGNTIAVGLSNAPWLTNVREAVMTKLERIQKLSPQEKKMITVIAYFYVRQRKARETSDFMSTYTTAVSHGFFREWHVNLMNALDELEGRLRTVEGEPTAEHRVDLDATLTASHERLARLALQEKDYAGVEPEPAEDNPLDDEDFKAAMGALGATEQPDE